MAGWIAVDLDGTLAEYHGIGDGSIGKPIPPMVKRVKRWLSEGRDVRIFTARVAGPHAALDERRKIRAWCQEHLGQELEVTNQKDHGTVEIWDDRAVQVRKNTGEPVDFLRRDRD